MEREASAVKDGRKLGFSKLLNILQRKREREWLGNRFRKCLESRRGCFDVTLVKPGTMLRGKKESPRRTRWLHAQRFTAIPRAPSFTLFPAPIVSHPERIADRVAFSISPLLIQWRTLKMVLRSTRSNDSYCGGGSIDSGG